MSNNNEWGYGCLVIVALVIWWVWSFFGWDNDETSYKNNPEVYSKERRECIEPENPYNEWSGHYAGFAWWEEWKSCWGNSSSFIEGCEVAEEQYSAFTECEDNQ